MKVSGSEWRCVEMYEGEWRCGDAAGEAEAGRPCAARPVGGVHTSLAFSPAALVAPSLRSWLAISKAKEITSQKNFFFRFV